MQNWSEQQFPVKVEGYFKRSPARQLIALVLCNTRINTGDLDNTIAFADNKKLG